MADNVVLDPGAGGATIATDDIGTVHYQRVKLTDGTADSATFIHSGGGTETNALRVTLANDSTGLVSVDDGGGSLTVDVGNAISTSYNYNEDTVAGDGATGAAILGVRNDAAASKTSADGDYSMVAVDAAGRLGIADLGGSISVDDNAGSLTVDGTITANLAAGTNNIGDVDVLTIAAGTNAIGNVGIIPRTTGGLSISRVLSAASTNATSAKASAGQVFGWYLYNDNAAERYFKLYNKASAPTVGTDTPVITIPIPAGSAANVFTETGIAFATGIAYAVTTAAADSDTGAVAANEIIINLFYA